MSLSQNSFSLLLVLGLSSSSFIHIHLLHNPLFMLSNSWHMNLVVHCQSLLIVLLIVVVILDRTRQDGELHNGISTVVPSHGVRVEQTRWQLEINVLRRVSRGLNPEGGA